MIKLASLGKRLMGGGLTTFGAIPTWPEGTSVAPGVDETED